MQLIKISKNGWKYTRPEKIEGSKGSYWAVRHGEKGRGRWEVMFPFAVREFPCEEPNSIPTGDGDFSLVSLKRQDKRGNEQYLLVGGEEDGRFLVFWLLSPGYRGGASYKVEGNAKIISVGEQAEGAAGRMGGADCPVVLVNGVCRLTWERTGRIYGSPKNWVAEYDGKEWSVSPENECVLEEAALNY